MIYRKFLIWKCALQNLFLGLHAKCSDRRHDIEDDNDGDDDDDDNYDSFRMMVMMMIMTVWLSPSS